jgi:Ribosomally synthesized peptide prototyped by Frankia Franean1_4349.
MATDEEMYALIGRAVADPAFRAKLMTDPQAAAQEAGYTLTEEQLAALKSAEGKGLAAVLEERLPKSARTGII